MFIDLSAKGCLKLQELEVDRTIAISEEIAYAMCLYGLRGLETISFTFTPVSPGAIKELLGKIQLYYMASLRSGQDKPNHAAIGLLSGHNGAFLPAWDNNKSFIDQACLLKIDGYRARSSFASLMTSTKKGT